MAKTEAQINVELLLLADYKSGKFSQRDLVEKYSFSKGKVSRLCKEQKAINGALIKDAVDTTIKQNEIMGQIGALSGAERIKVIYEIQEATNKANIINMFDHTTVQNQIGINSIQEKILKKELSREDIFDLGSISKVTETNRKQIFGTTDTYKPESKPDESKRIGLGDLYKDIVND